MTEAEQSQLRAEVEGLEPLLRALDKSGWMRGPEFSRAIRRAHSAEVEGLRGERDRLLRLVNTPETEDFLGGVRLEAAHQRERWGSNHDAGKAPLDWFWLIGFLAQKAAAAQIDGDLAKAKHHTISTAAALANWHLAILGVDTSMRPGIDPLALTNKPDGGAK